MGFTTRLSRLPQDYWRERNVLEKMSQVLLKGTAFSDPFLGQPFLHHTRHPLPAGSPPAGNQPCVTSPCHPVVPLLSWPPLHVQIIAIVISRFFYEEILCFSLTVLLRQSSVTLYLDNKSPGHTLHARQQCLLNNGPARCLFCLSEEHASQLQHL